jgi:hypothetical protein
MKCKVAKWCTWQHAKDKCHFVWDTSDLLNIWCVVWNANDKWHVAWNAKWQNVCKRQVTCWIKYFSPIKKDLGQAQPYIATTTVSKMYNLTEDNLTIEWKDQRSK